MEPFSSYKPNLFLNLVLVYILWGSTYLGVKIGLQDLTPLLLTGIRFTVGGIILFSYSLLNTRTLDIKEVIGSFKIGFLLSGIGTSAVAYAILYIPSGIVAVLVATLPVWIFLLDFFFFSKKAPSWLSAIGMLTGLVGVLFLFDPFGQVKNAQEHINYFVVAIIFIGTISWAFGSLLSSKTKQVKGTQGIALQMISGGFIALTLSLFLESNQIDQLIHIHLNSVLAMTYLIFIGSFIGYTSYVWLINNAPPLLTSTYAFVNPVVALFLGFFIAHELLQNQTIIACAIILFGVVLMTIGRRRKNFES
ncbi:Permease of the drug/metabolite transporter (DMT) superfamily [Spirosomataceae bacterium TFI 002]|nr:Permease of the drug/metabolite transporter (DMT) superfamily [Spirosomataceae bacterium TFI 002]